MYVTSYGKCILLGIFIYLSINKTMCFIRIPPQQSNEIASHFALF